MKSSRLGNTLLWLLVNVCRFTLSVTLTLSGVAKMIDPRGTEYKIKEYALGFGLDEYMWFYTPLMLSVVLALAEFNIGIGLFFANNRRWISRIVLCTFLLFTPFTLYLAIENPIHDCGCFGDVLTLTNWQTFIKNVVLLICAIVIALFYRKQTRIISVHNQWLVSLYTWVFSFALTLYCIYTLPVIDFRPYHIGADIAEKMMWDDSGKVPPITDLVITDPATGEILTDNIVSGQGWKFLIVAPRLENADDGVMDKLTELTDYCRDHGYMLTGLTSSSDSLINHWSDITGAEYPFLIADEIPLKTMIRSNPGLLLLKDGVVVNKWASSEIPGSSDLVAPLEQLPDLTQEYSTYTERSLLLFLWYIIPLLVCTVLDRLWLGYKIYRERKYKTNLKLKKQ